MLLDAQEFVMVEKQVIEAIAVFASHGNSGGSAPWEINLVQKLELEDKAYEEMRHN